MRAATRLVTVGSCGLVLGVACGGASGSGAEPPVTAQIAVTPAPRTPVAPPMSAATAAASKPAPVPYPDAWITQARSDNGAHSCQSLIYKRGCAEKRTGTITVRLTLSLDGTPSVVEVLKNEIRREPEVVEKCVTEALPKWRFQPPAGTESTFEMKLVFADAC